MSIHRLPSSQPSRPAHAMQPILPTKTDLRTQFAALCFREKGNKTEILLITTRRSGKWVLPKGWPMKGKTPQLVAQQEAWEEAGVKGKVVNLCLGVYSYRKRTAQGVILPCIALIYPVRVDKLQKNWPELGQRRRKWFSPKKAATKVRSPELARALRDFDPRMLRG